MHKKIQKKMQPDKMKLKSRIYRFSKIFKKNEKWALADQHSTMAASASANALKSASPRRFFRRFAAGRFQ